MTLADLIQNRSAAATSKLAADQAVVADQAKLAADQGRASDLGAQVTASEAALTSALASDGPVIDTDGQVYEVIAGQFRVFKPSPAASVVLPDPAPPAPPAVDPAPPAPAAPAAPAAA